MGRQRKKWVQRIVLGLIVLALVGVGVAAGPRVVHWFQATPRGEGAAPSALIPTRLIRDVQGNCGLLVPPETVRGLGIRTAPVQQVTQKRPLPGMLGQTAYVNNLIYPVRSIGNGKIVQIEKVFDPSLPGESKYRAIGPGDKVEEGQLLAVVRSPDLAEKKGAYVDALLDLSVDVERLQGLEGPYRRGAIPEASYRDAKARVEKDYNAVSRARRILELVPLKSKEIKALQDEAEAIRHRLRALAKEATADLKEDPEYRARVERWARVEVPASAAGVIVEANTNLGDIVDPGKDPPLFRIANLDSLSIWINPPQEYLPVLQKLLRENPGGEIQMQLRVESEPEAPLLKGWLLRIAPSIDPNVRTPLVIGRVQNPGHRLLVGQLLRVTIFVPQDSDLVEIPMSALNEVGGQSLVFVQKRGFFQGTPEYFLRRVQVVNRFQKTAQIRARVRLTAQEKEQMAEEIRHGLLPIEALRPGEWVVTEGVVEMTDALQDLQADEQGKDKESR